MTIDYFLNLLVIEGGKVVFYYMLLWKMSYKFVNETADSSLQEDKTVWISFDYVIETHCFSLFWEDYP